MAKPWYAVYRNFDDDALAALASVGLLRRASKDVEAGKVAWRGTPGDTGGSIVADGQHVVLGADGPQRARCDCPAPGMCKHVLAAALWLRGLPEATGGDAPAAAPEGTPSTEPVDVLAEVLAIDQAALFKAAGRAAARQAAGVLVRDADVAITLQGGSVLVTFAEPACVCRYVAGAGFAGMVSDAPAAISTGMHLAAVLAVWRRHDRAFAWPDGIDEASQDDTGDVLAESERQFLLQVRRVLYELCETGLSHVGEVVHGQLRAINMSARSERLPRLAGILRTLAGTIDLLARRDVHADERQAMVLLARIHALCAALEVADEITMPALRGRVRRDFEAGASLDLLPLGAYWWENRSGARGLTVSFWEAGAQRVVQAVLARPDGSDPGFDKSGAWSRHSLWKGVGAAEHACAGALRLDMARIADDGRVALGGDARAIPGNAWREDDPRWAAAGFDDWAALAQFLRRSTGLTGEPVDCILLRPHSVTAPRLDEVRQTLEWIVTDRHGSRLLLQLPCEESYRARIDQLERLVGERADILGIAVRLDHGVRSGTLEPVALVIRNGKLLQPVSLDFAHGDSKRPLALTGRILRLLKSRQAAPAALSRSFATRVLGPVLDLVERQLMTGRLRPDDTQRELLEQERGTMRTVGLDVVADAIDCYLRAPGAGHALQLVHLCMTGIELDAGFLLG